MNDSSAAGAPSPRRSGSLVGSAFAVATVLGILETARGVWLGRAVDPDFGLLRAAAANLPWWYLWAATVPLVETVVRRRRPWLHVVAGPLLVLIHLALSAVTVWLASSHRFQGLDAQFRSLLTGYLLSDLVTYAAIAAALTAVMTNRRLQAADEERNRLTLEASQLEADRARLREQATRARLSALRSELNPHFLYNALNGVSALARRGDTDRAITMLARLGELLRRTLDPGLDREVPLARELELLELYLSIERIRYGERLSVTIACEPGARSVLVPSFLLQPIVENAIRHGVAAVRRSVEIHVSARLEGGVLALQVRDTGPGFVHGPETEGVGLSNTRHRLSTAYGDQARLSIESAPGVGTTVSARMPARREEPALVG